MNPKTVKKVNKHLNNTINLKTHEVNLSLKKLDQINLNVLERVNSEIQTEIRSINNNRRKLLQRIDAVLDDVKIFGKILFDADGEVKSIIRTVEEAGITAAPMKQRLNEINKMEQQLKQIGSSASNVKKIINSSI
jgi:hypothetical protein